MTETDHVRAYWQGYNLAENNIPSENPYNKETFFYLWESWELGWYDGRKDYVEKTKHGH